MIQIFQKDQIIIPTVTKSIDWTTSRVGSAGKLSFSTIDEPVESPIKLGDRVAFYHEGEGVFLGRIFSITGDNGEEVKYTAYDNTYYFKNVNNFSYENQTLGETLAYICGKLNIEIGEIANTGHHLTRVEENAQYWEMILNAVDETVLTTGRYYIIYDKFGKITMKDNREQIVEFLLDKETCIKFSYGSDIVNSYNRVTMGDHRAEDSGNIEDWGILNMYENEDAPTPDRVEALLSLYNRPTRAFNAEAIGDIRIRAGSIFPVYMKVGNMNFKTYFIADEVTHKINAGTHTMNLKIVGGGGYIA